VSTCSTLSSVEDVIDARAVVAVYQPLVDLLTGEVVGYEALARGPQGSPWERPDVLFAAARACGRLA
jgi:sensor c-di-GMP phosphodiesterase-like protein